ncbi:hypothetical protein NEOC84_001010|nr:hypothetical protein [Neochlamydia sp. AcF84]
MKNLHYYYKEVRAFKALDAILQASVKTKMLTNSYFLFPALPHLHGLLIVKN